MRTAIFRLAAIFALVASALVFGTAASAAPGMGVGGGAVHGGGCADSGPTTLGLTMSYCAKEVQTPSGYANATLHGQITDPTQIPTKTTQLSGFPCYTSYGETFDTQATVTPNGNVNAWCKFTPVG
ncbi:MAG: hypothetical protein LC793_15780 [Thermomicrobia bacterium]|nr:hypothetical protein [Thermomicrobia bacterium]